MTPRGFACAFLVLMAALAAAGVGSSERRAGAEARWVEETLKGLSTRVRRGQVLMAPVLVEQATGARLEELKRQLTELGLGGVVVRGGSPETVAALTNELQRASRVPLFVGADYERGLRLQM